MFSGCTCLFKSNQVNKMTNANGHGGRREGAGRKSDAQKMLYAIPSALELLGRGITPVEQMLLQMRKAWERVLVQQEIIDAKIGKGQKPEPTELKDLANLECAAFSFAEKCAPYIHPRLTATKLEGASEPQFGNSQFIPGDENL